MAAITSQETDVAGRGIEHSTIVAGGLSWDVGTTGEWSGEPVLLLHGFPEHWRTWGLVMPALASEGFRVHAACLPGYGETTAPNSYAIDDVAAHVADLCREIGTGSAHVVGHDWGGIIAAAAASLHPDAVRSVTLCSCAHPSAFLSAVNDPSQLARSSYVALFQLPAIEHLLGNRVLIERFSSAVTDIEGSGEMARALAYYRSNLRPWDLNNSMAGRIRVPGLVIHGAHDPVITERLMRETTAFLDDLRGFEIIDCGHFVHRDGPDDLLAVLLPFLRQVRAERSFGVEASV